MTNSKPFADANVIRGTREAIRQQPELGNLTFNMKSKSNGGVSVRGNSCDYPERRLIPVAPENLLMLAMNLLIYRVLIAVWAQLSTFCRHLPAVIPRL